ncbi:hypothetical protein RUM44_005485 [Polyplax serrata]|uniref:MARVEL domain-containing protein n=1 Tax=Polyplax serrata TaxID=468196 RepID=A0ABR1ADI6_POLSC
MKADSDQYVQSVSDLYGTDEIDVLLEEIRDLEPANCRAEDVQDFEIAGSRTGVANLESPAVTVKSWDSHANYRHHTGNSASGSLFSGVIVYCDESHFKSVTGILRVLLIVTCIASLACLCSSGTVKVGIFMLPLAGRLRLMMFITIFCLLVTCLFLFLDISHIVYLFPFNWGKLNVIIYLTISFMYILSASLIVQMIHAEAFFWVPKWSKHRLMAAGILGYVCGILSILISFITKCHRVQYCPVSEDPSQMMLQDTIQSDTKVQRPPPVIQQRRAPPKPVPISTKSTPVNSWPVDDVQPCTSKSAEPYVMV